MTEYRTEHFLHAVVNGGGWVLRMHPLSYHFQGLCLRQPELRHFQMWTGIPSVMIERLQRASPLQSPWVVFDPNLGLTCTDMKPKP